jgi:hypothetical protein
MVELVIDLAFKAMSIIGFIFLIFMANDYRKMRGQWKTWSPVLKAFEERIPLINQIPTLWGKLMQQIQMGGKSTPEQREVRAKIVDGFQQELPSRVPVVGAALANSLAKLTGDDKAILLTDGEFIGSILKIVSTAGDGISKIQNFFSPKESKEPQKRRGKADKRLKAPSL